MEFIEIIIAALAATSAMTLFSYLISETFRKLYKEPLLLEFLMSSLDFKLSGRQKAIVSWSLHYFIGLLFVILYYLPIWLESDWYQVTIESGLIFGCIVGSVGIAGWNIMFRLSPMDPPADTGGYYLQLFFAHIIFALTVVTVHWIVAAS